MKGQGLRRVHFRGESLFVKDDDVSNNCGSRVEIATLAIRKEARIKVDRWTVFCCHDVRTFVSFRFQMFE